MSLDVTWLTAFLDLPPAVHSDTVAFWLATTGSTVSSARGEAGQFATLLPPEGTSCLKVQRLDGPARVHLDLHVADLPAAHDRALAAGAIEVAAYATHVILRTPGGFVLCLVPHPGGRVPPPVTRPGTGSSRVSQVCLDVPAAGFAAEVDFLSGLTGWQVRAFPEVDGVVALEPAAPGGHGATAGSPSSGVPLRLIVQRLGAEDPGTATRAHLEFWADDAAAEVERHRGLGARPVSRGPYWQVLSDPAGLPYCVIGRDPWTGRRVTA